MSFNAVQHNRHQHNRGSGAATALVQNPFVSYTLELRSSGGALVATLPLWSNGKTKDVVNEHGTLSFDYPYASPAGTAYWSQFAHARQVWLRDDRGRIREKYHVTDRARGKDADGRASIAIEGRSLIYQWSRERVTNFFCGNEQQTITLPSGVTGGTWTATFRNQTTSALAYNASAGTVQTALVALSTIGSGQVSVSGSAGGPYTVEFTGTLAETDAAKIRCNGSGLTGGALIKTSTTRTTKTVREALQFVLNNFQTHTAPIYLGTIDPAIGDQVVSVKWETKTLLACVLELRDLFGGYFWVDPSNRRFYWKRTRGRRTGQFVRIGYNGQNIREREDFTTLATRVTALGRGETIESTLSVTVNDATAQSAYGIIHDTIVDKTIWNLTDLTAFANANLQARKAPKKSYGIGTIDLARVKTGDYEFFELEAGSALRVIDSEFDLSISTTIAAIERDIDNGTVAGSAGGGASGAGRGGRSKVRIAVTNPDAGTTTWGANEPSIIPAEERTAADTIADILGMVLDEVQADSGFEDSLLETFPDIMTGENTASETIRETIETVIEQLIEDGDVSVPTPGSGILSVGTANADGTSDNYARVDHVHKGNHFSAASVGALPAMAEGNTWHTTSGTKYWGVYINGATEIVSHM